MISKDLLHITGYKLISILIRTINVPDSGSINAALMLNKDMILTADDNKRMI